MYVGGIDNDSAYSGRGMLIMSDETRRFYVNNAAALTVCAAVSGELICWIGYSNGTNVNMDASTQGTRPDTTAASFVGWTPVSGTQHITSGGSNQTIIATVGAALVASTVNTSSFLLRLAGSSTNLSGVVTVCGENAIFTPNSGIFAAAINAPSTSAQFVPIIIGSGTTSVGMRTTDTNYILDVSGSYHSETSMAVTSWNPVSGSTHQLSGLQMEPLLILAQFDRTLLSGTVGISSFIVRASGAAANLSGSVTVSGDNCTFTMASGIIVTTSAQYHPIIIGSGSAVGMKDLAGNFVSNTTGMFVTLNTMILSGWTPVSGATHVFSGTGTPSLRILAEFDRNLLSGTVNISSFIFRQAGSATNLSGSVQVSGTNCTFIVASGVVTSTSTFYHPIILGSGNAVGMQDLQGTFTNTVSGAFMTMTEPII